MDFCAGVGALAGPELRHIPRQWSGVCSTPKTTARKEEITHYQIRSYLLVSIAGEGFEDKTKIVYIQKVPFRDSSRGFIAGQKSRKRKEISPDGAI